MNLLITGANGQLGNEMRVLAPQHPEHNYFFTDIAELDITDKQAVKTFVQENRIEAIVNCAAYTNVDRAEEDETTAYRINAEAPQILGEAAQQAGALLIHISTDYVFNGNACLPYRESDSPAPNTAYGRTKLAGEQLLLEACPSALIIRTAWLYSSFGNNFVKTMLRLAKERNTLSVVYDQIGTPTYAADLAQAIYTILPQLRNNNTTSPRIFHFTNEGVCSWFDFTKEILHQAKLTTEVLPIRSEQYQYRTPRPHYSVLDKQKIKDTFAVKVPYWTESLSRCLQILLNEQ